MEETLRVLTIQDFDLRRFKEMLNLGRGTYNDDPIITAAQRKLYNALKACGKLGDDNVIWCSRSRPVLHDQVGRHLHVIEADPKDADPKDVIAVIYSLVWCHIIRYDSRYIPS
jgi:hypothetical protein